MSKVIRVSFGFALLRLVIGIKKNSRHFLIQSEVRTKPTVSRPRTFGHFHYDAQSAKRKKMAPRVAFWVDRDVGPKFTVFVWQPVGKPFPYKIKSELL